MRRPGRPDDELPVRHTPANRTDQESKLRRDRRHCPVCLAALPRITGKGRLAHKCVRCGAQPQPGKRCAKCLQEAVWEARTKAACQSCANHGSKVRVVAGMLETAGANERPLACDTDQRRRSVKVKGLSGSS
jgi:hypothetical protein